MQMDDNQGYSLRCEHKIFSANLKLGLMDFIEFAESELLCEALGQYICMSVTFFLKPYILLHIFIFTDILSFYICQNIHFTNTSIMKSKMLIAFYLNACYSTIPRVEKTGLTSGTTRDGTRRIPR